MTQDEIKTVLIEEIKRKLLKKGHTLSSWARAYGYNIRNVNAYIHLYAANPRLPQSPTIYEILSKIRTDTGVDLITGSIKTEKVSA